MEISNIILMMGSGDEKGGGASSFIFLALIIVVFYFFMIRPQVKKTKEQKKFREAIKRGDQIITIGGIHGKITDVQEMTFTIETEGGNRMKIEKSAVATGHGELMDTQK